MPQTKPMIKGRFKRPTTAAFLKTNSGDRL